MFFDNVASKVFMLATLISYKLIDAQVKLLEHDVRCWQILLQK